MKLHFHVDNRSDEIPDSEITALLMEAYVGGGFTSLERAARIFDPTAVRSRGELITARTSENVLAGMVIVVQPGSPARRIAEPDEAEIHLLAVANKYRGLGLGRRLMSQALKSILDLGLTRTILWTQPTMIPAHRLYESMGFVRAHGRDPVLDETYFLAYEKRNG